MAQRRERPTFGTNREDPMQCEEIMKTDVQCLSEQDQVVDAARKMRDEGVGFLPICDGDSQVLGTITDRDIVIRVVAENRPLDETPVADVMTREVIACRPEDDVSRAEELMGRHHKSRILVIDDDRQLVGIISLSDLAAYDGVRALETLREVSERETHA
jgi:CBS domain-containing protein